jgi:hypothetical protein
MVDLLGNATHSLGWQDTQGIVNEFGEPTCCRPARELTAWIEERSLDSASVDEESYKGGRRHSI